MGTEQKRRSSPCGIMAVRSRGLSCQRREIGGTRMPARTPEELPPLFAQAFGAHDLEAALALYEPEAILIPQPGQVVTGTGAIREALSGFFALKPKFESEFKEAFQVGEIALLFSDWTLSATDPDGVTP